MNSAQLSAKELESIPRLESSWHMDHRNTNSVVIGRLPTEMNEMDIIIMFSQWGHIASLKLLRDKYTGRSNGVAFLRYERWESAVCCVDNFNGVGPDKGLKVDHCIFRGYRYDDEIDGGDANRAWDEAVEKILAEEIVDPLEDNAKEEGSEKKRSVKTIDQKKDSETDDLEDPMAKYIQDKKKRSAKK